MTTRVVNVKDYKPYSMYWTANPTPDSPYVYIGRRTWPIQINSKWRNRYNARIYGRDKAVRKYRDWIITQPELLRLIPIEIKDKVLGCWCKPAACHGDVLVELATN